MREVHLVRVACLPKHSTILEDIGVDTAENEPLEVWGKIQFIIHLPPYPLSARELFVVFFSWLVAWRAHVRLDVEGYLQKCRVSLEF